MLRIGAAAALVLAAALTGCAQPAADAPTSPSAQEPDASATAAPIAPTADPDAEASAEPNAGTTWETQDGAMRLRLPEGWRVDDRSAMTEASEMHDRGPGWLNDVVMLDSAGDRMLWYREAYGDDAVDCGGVRAWPIEVPIDPYAAELADQLEGEGEAPRPVLIIGDADAAGRWSADAAPGTGAGQLGLRSRFAPQDEQCDNLDESIPAGDRIVQVDVVADGAGAAQPDTTIDFPDVAAARAWLEGDEAATLVEVLSSIELTAAPVLDAAP